MKNKKALALIISVTLIVSMTLPGTLAVSEDQAAALDGLSLIHIFALGYFFLGFPISLSIAEAIFDFAGKLVSFDIARLPSAVLPFEDVFAFGHVDILLVN